MKIKKLWILHDYTETIEEIEQEYNKKYLGFTSMGMCACKIGFVEGDYIIMPVDGDIKYYRNELIKSMIKNEKTKITIATRKLGDLLDMM